MTKQQDMPEVYEPYNFHGDNPMHADGLGVVVGPVRDNYYLVSLEQPFQINGDPVRHILLQPHYNGDKIDRAVNSTCTVNIGHVINGMAPDHIDKLAFDDFERWGVGKISLPIQ